MAKNVHEIRDPIHVFVRLDSHERRVLDSRPFQRLRHIHQLALTYLVYPGATHRRFEHSLGVMELADRVYTGITKQENVDTRVQGLLPSEDELRYWRRVLRMAALCHDIGHLPFSHAAERELLPEGWDHERLTREIILTDEMKAIWESLTPPLRPQDIVKLAVGPDKARDLTFSDWESILSEIIVGDAFGVDRMDYLLRDSYHAGVAYGRFDHYRLIDTLRILPTLPLEAPRKPTEKDGHTMGDSAKLESSRETTLGIEEGGLQSAEALMLARYFMYSQVYFHAVRRIYDIHLKDFLKSWLPAARFSTDLDKHLAVTDNEVTAALFEADADSSQFAHFLARRIVRREHFKTVYQRNPSDSKVNPLAGRAVFKALCKNFGEEQIRHDYYVQKGGAPDFPVKMRDERIESSLALSETLQHLPVVKVDYVFVDRTIHREAEELVNRNRSQWIQIKAEEDNHGSAEKSSNSEQADSQDA